MKGSKFPVVPSPQFQRQMICSQSESGPGDHLFKARSGLAQTKSADVVNFELVATQTIIWVYCRPKVALTADVLSNVFRQLCTHTSIVVEQPSRPLAREQFFVQASASDRVPPAPPVAESPPVPTAPPEAEEPPLETAPPVAEPPVPPLPAGGVPAPGAPPEADEPPVAPVVPPVDVGPVLLLLPHADTQAAAPNTKTRAPILFFNMSSPNFDAD